MEKCNIKIPSPAKKKFRNMLPISSALGSKIIDLQDIIKRTILSSQKYKTLDIFGANELNLCINSLEAMFSTLNALLLPITEGNKIDDEKIISVLQDITNDLSSLFRTFGTNSIEDLIMICFGADFAQKNFINNSILDKYAVMKKLRPSYQL